MPQSTQAHRGQRDAPGQQRPLDLDRYRTLLTETKAQLEMDLERYRSRSRDLGGGPDEPGPGDHWEHSGYGDHQADEGTELFEREKAVGMELVLADRLQQVDHAMTRIEAGTYGICERCGKPIPASRLDALPEAALCIDCKAEMER
jgi:RNA polymerase-binding transcription factor DksA